MGIQVHTTSRLLRWYIIPLFYDFHMEYESTHAEMEQGGWLSYLNYKEKYPDEEALIASVTVEEDRHCRSFDGAILKTISIFPKIQIQKLYLEEN